MENMKYVTAGNYKTYSKFSKLKLFGAPGKVVFELGRVCISFVVYMVLILILGFDNVLTMLAVAVFGYYVIKLLWHLFFLIMLLIFSPLGTINLCKRTLVYCKTGRIITPGHVVEVEVE